VKQTLLFIFLIAFINELAYAAPTSVNETYAIPGKKKVEVGAFENDAEISVNGKIVGKGSAEVTVGKNDCVTVEVKIIYFLT